MLAIFEVIIKVWYSKVNVKVEKVEWLIIADEELDKKLIT